MDVRVAALRSTVQGVCVCVYVGALVSGPCAYHHNVTYHSDKDDYLRTENKHISCRKGGQELHLSFTCKLDIKVIRPKWSCPTSVRNGINIYGHICTYNGMCPSRSMWQLYTCLHNWFTLQGCYGCIV